LNLGPPYIYAFSHMVRWTTPGATAGMRADPPIPFCFAKSARGTRRSESPEKSATAGAALQPYPNPAQLKLPALGRFRISSHVDVLSTLRNVPCPLRNVFEGGMQWSHPPSFERFPLIIGNFPLGHLPCVSLGRIARIVHLSPALWSAVKQGRPLESFIAGGPSTAAQGRNKQRFHSSCQPNRSIVVRAMTNTEKLSPPLSFRYAFHACSPQRSSKSSRGPPRAPVLAHGSTAGTRLSSSYPLDHLGGFDLVH
jgi:hypothetical protein